MTILFFTRLFYPHIGGVEKHVLEVGKRLIKKGHRVIVITEEILSKDIPVYQLKDTSAKMTGEVDGIEILRIPVGKEQNLSSRHAGLSSISHRRERFWMRSAYQNDGGGVVAKDDWFKKFRIWWWLWQHKELIEKADIVHCHDVFFWYLPYKLFFPFKKVYVTFHGYEGDSLPGKSAIFMHKLAEKLSNGNICVGKFLKKWYFTKPDYVTYGGIDLESLKVKKSINKRRIMFLGRLERETGIIDYLHALNTMKQKVSIDIYGGGSLLETAKKMTEKYGIKAVFKGFVPDADKLIGKYDLLFTSRYLGILEGLVSKIPIIAVYNNEIKRDYLIDSPFGKYAYICSNETEIARKTLSLLDHKDTKRINKGYEWAKKQTWDNVVTVYIRLWFS